MTKPDKGKGVIILDKTKYISSLLKLISDKSKFSEIKESPSKFTTRIEDKVNSLLRKLKKKGSITENLYKKMYATGTGPGILYGLPKTHKSNFSTEFPLRPIFNSCNTPTYNISKFLVNLLNPFTTNSNSIDNSKNFVEDICSLKGFGSHFMASFDVDNLFTNVPVRETIEICLRNVFGNVGSNFHGFDAVDLRIFLETTVLNSYFLVDGKYYKQEDGLGMGIPLGPTLANIFMSDLENRYLSSCPLYFKPVYYKRYVDDTFVLFKEESHVQLFLNHINSFHSNIHFTKETEINNKLNFLDCTIVRKNDGFETLVYRKSTFTQLGTSFFSFIPNSFKLNSINTLINRAYNVSSSYFSLDKEFTFLKRFFKINGFPLSLIESKIRNFMSKIRSQKSSCFDVKKKVLYCSFVYFGSQSKKLKIELSSLIAKYFYHLEVKFILSNSYSIGSLFRFKDSLPPEMRSSIIYKYSCEQCSSEYIGCTSRTLRCRIREHQGISFRTGKPLLNPSFSAIRSHGAICP